MAGQSGLRGGTPRKKALELLAQIEKGWQPDEATGQRSGEGYASALAGILALTGKDLVPTTSEDDRAVHQVLGAALVYQGLTMLRLLVEQNDELLKRKAIL